MFYRCFTNSFFKEHLQVAASMEFSEVSGWLLFKTSRSEVFFRRIINFSEQTFKVCLHSASKLNCMKESVTVNKE